MRLRENALDRFPEELFGVQERYDAGNQRLFTHPISITILGPRFWKPAQRSNHLSSCAASLSPLQFRTQMRGNWKGSLDLRTTSTTVEHAHAKPARRTSSTVSSP